MTDPHAAFRHLDGQVVHAYTVEPIEDDDGQLLGMSRTYDGPATFVVPALPEDETDR
jgi:hypothetical protein